MPTKRLSRSDKLFYERLGQRIRKIILSDKGYSSLDAFALAHHDQITKPTLYQICEGKRDMKISTVRGLAKALGVSLEALIAGI